MCEKTQAHSVKEVGALNELRSKRMLTPMHLEIQSEGLHIDTHTETG